MKQISYLLQKQILLDFLVPINIQIKPFKKVTKGERNNENVLYIYNVTEGHLPTWSIPKMVE